MKKQVVNKHHCIGAGCVFCMLVQQSGATPLQPLFKEQKEKK